MDEILSSETLELKNPENKCQELLDKSKEISEQSQPNSQDLLNILFELQTLFENNPLLKERFTEQVEALRERISRATALSEASSTRPPEVSGEFRRETIKIPVRNQTTPIDSAPVPQKETESKKDMRKFAQAEINRFTALIRKNPEMSYLQLIGYEPQPKKRDFAKAHGKFVAPLREISDYFSKLGEKRTQSLKRNAKVTLTSEDLSDLKLFDQVDKLFKFFALRYDLYKNKDIVLDLVAFNSKNPFDETPTNKRQTQSPPPRQPAPQEEVFKPKKRDTDIFSDVMNFQELKANLKQTETLQKFIEVLDEYLRGVNSLPDKELTNSEKFAKNFRLKIGQLLRDFKELSEDKVLSNFSEKEIYVFLTTDIFFQFNFVHKHLSRLLYREKFFILDKKRFDSILSATTTSSFLEIRKVVRSFERKSEKIDYLYMLIDRLFVANSTVSSTVFQKNSISQIERMSEKPDLTQDEIQVLKTLDTMDIPTELKERIKYSYDRYHKTELLKQLDIALLSENRMLRILLEKTLETCENRFNQFFSDQSVVSNDLGDNSQMISDSLRKKFRIQITEFYLQHRLKKIPVTSLTNSLKLIEDSNFSISLNFQYTESIRFNADIAETLNTGLDFFRTITTPLRSIEIYHSVGRPSDFQNVVQEFWVNEGRGPASEKDKIDKYKGIILPVLVARLKRLPPEDPSKQAEPNEERADIVSKKFNLPFSAYIDAPDPKNQQAYILALHACLILLQNDFGFKKERISQVLLNLNLDSKQQNILEAADSYFFGSDGQIAFTDRAESSIGIEQTEIQRRYDPYESMQAKQDRAADLVEHATVRLDFEKTFFGVKMAPQLKDVANGNLMMSFKAAELLSTEEVEKLKLKVYEQDNFYSRERILEQVQSNEHLQQKIEELNLFLESQFILAVQEKDFVNRLGLPEDKVLTKTEWACLFFHIAKGYLSGSAEESDVTLLRSNALENALSIGKDEFLLALQYGKKMRTGNPNPPAPDIQ